MFSKEQTQQLRETFWTNFGLWCENQPALLHRKPMWMLYNTKIRHVQLKFDATRKHADVILEVNHKNEELRLDVYEIIEKYRNILESGLEGVLIWDFLYTLDDGKPVARAYCRLHNVDYLQEKYHEAIFTFFMNHMLLLETNFMDIAEFVKEEIERM